MFLTPNEIPSNRHLDAIIDRWQELPSVPGCTTEALALARAESVALHYLNQMHLSTKRI